MIKICFLFAQIKIKLYLVIHFITSQNYTLMDFNNLGSLHLTISERDQAFSLIDQLQTLLQSKLVQLNAEERKKYGSVNEQNKLLINKVRDYSRAMPNLRDPDVDWTEFEADYLDRETLEMLSTRLLSFVYALESTKIVHDYDNYHASLNDYSHAQYRAERKQAEYIQKVNDLQQLFPRSSNSKGKDDSAEDTVVK